MMTDHHFDASEPAPKRRGTGRTLKQQSLDPGDSPDMTFAEVKAFRREGDSTDWRKVRSGRYVSYKSGDKRLITRESVLADREQCLAEGPQLTEAPPEGRPPGRPKAKAGAEV
jgi:hypothetical protein